MRKIESVITYKVWYKRNEEYTGKFQVDKIGGGGLHATVTPAMGGMERALQEAARCKAWFNDEKIAVEHADERGKVTIEVKITFHDNVTVWIEKYRDDYPCEEEVPCPDKPREKAAKSVDPRDAEIASLQATVAELAERLEAMEKRKGRKAREPEEELAGV